RAAIGNPWIFNQVKHFFKTGEELAPPTLSERMDAVKSHLKFSIEWKGDKKGIFEMRRHYTNYFRGIPGFKPFRARLVESPTYEDTMQILDEIEDIFQADNLVNQ
ncbi:tRNA-dihydrouridine synthase, partial [Reichenbachiella sp.]